MVLQNAGSPADEKKMKLRERLPWLLPLSILTVGSIAALTLASAIRGMEQLEFEAVADQVVAEMTGAYSETRATVAMFGAAAARGIDTAEFGAASQDAPTRYATALEAVAWLPANSVHPPLIGFATSPAFFGDLGRPADGELTYLGDASYLMVLESPEGEARAVFSMARLASLAGERSSSLVTMTLRSGGEQITEAAQTRRDFVIDRAFEIGGLDFDARMVAGASYSGSGALPAGYTTLGFTIVLALTSIRIRRAVRARISAETDRAELAEEIIASKDRFLASVAHELRTPLSVVMAMAIELATNPDSHSLDERQEMLVMAANESMTIRNTVDDMLVTARLASGDLTINRERCDLVDLARAHLSTLDNTGVTLSCVCGGLDPIEVDPGRWIHAFRNILSNALEHAETAVDVRFSQDERFTRVTVDDDGPGIPVERIDLAFEPYQQFSSEPTAPSPVGVGLSVARGLARAMGGDVTYRRVGVRSRFELSVPNGIGPVPDEQLAPRAVAAH